MGLVDQIKSAATEEEALGLVEAGNKNYKLVSPKTKRRWGYVAQRRVKELQLAKEKKVSKKPEQAPTDEKKEPKKTPGRKPYKNKRS